MQEEKYITIISGGKTIVLNISTILYVLMTDRIAEIHVSGGKIYKTRMTLGELEEKFGDRFIKVHRGCLVSVMAIHDINDNICLNNGETLIYTLRKKKQIIEQFHRIQKNIISKFSKDNVPSTTEEYKNYYKSFENMPIAFTDIEMVFSDEKYAVDWIFRYGNPSLAQIEEMPLEQLIGSSFGSLFSNMDEKWLRIYERATLYGETLEIIDYSPEIKKYLKVICFPTFKGHCGCIMFDLSQIRLTKSSDDAEKALSMYFRNL